MKTILSAAIVAALCASGAAHAAVSGFDELPLAPESHYFPETAGTFTSGPARYNHDYTDYSEYGLPGCCHSGWIYSNRTDTTTAGHLNQHSAITGGGAEGSSNYAVANFGAPAITFDSALEVGSAWFTNTTYTALSMLQGDSFAKKFGGADGSDPDWLRLTVIGMNGAAQTGTVDFYLADFRFEDNSLDYVLDSWQQVNLSSLGLVTSLQFELASSDTGAFGINTPAYFAMDNLRVTAVPEPGQYALFASGLLLIGALVRRRQG
jgi:hypothetical protein